MKTALLASVVLLLTLASPAAAKGGQGSVAIGATQTCTPWTLSAHATGLSTFATLHVDLYADGRMVVGDVPLAYMQTFDYTVTPVGTGRKVDLTAFVHGGVQQLGRTQIVNACR